jgi:hypothetical protein
MQTPSKTHVHKAGLHGDARGSSPTMQAAQTKVPQIHDPGFVGSMAAVPRFRLSPVGVGGGTQTDEGVCCDEP